MKFNKLNQKHREDNASAIEGYTPEEQLWILACASDEYEREETKLQEMRKAFFNTYGYWPDF